MINRFITHRIFIFPPYLTLGHPSVTKRSVLAILHKAEAIYGPLNRPLAKAGSDRTGPERIGPDGIDKKRTGSITKSPPKSRRSPDNVLKTGKVEFCAFLSCVAVSSFIETR